MSKEIWADIEDMNLEDVIEEIMAEAEHYAVQPWAVPDSLDAALRAALYEIRTA